MSSATTSLKRSVSSLVPPVFRSIFPFTHFNHMQSIVAEEAFKTDENMVVAAPTGSGKTVIQELAICRVIQQKGPRPIRCIYIAPSKALCQQKFKEWHQMFTALNQTVLELTGDVDVRESLVAIAKASLVITTPEKWDSITRTWRDHVYLMSNIDLLLIDEIHHLGEDRGPTLEAVIVRMQYLASLTNTDEENIPPQGKRKRMRIVGLSATLPNISDIGEWLGCEPRHVHYFDDTFRPVPLEIHTLNYGPAPNPFLFERSLDSKVSDVIRRYSNGRQVLVFCSSKKNTEHVADKLFHSPGTGGKTLSSDALLLLQNRGIADKKLFGLLQFGIAYHHAGLLPDDRSAVEEFYSLGHIRILCSTSTLAHGINLPAYLVVVKGTFSWRGSINGYEKLRRSDIVQMIGRAGRPGFDTSGVAVVMTNQEDLAQYSNLTTGLERVESQLINNISEVINAEISQIVIASSTDCVSWLKTTFLFVCAKKGLLKDSKVTVEQFHSVGHEQFISDLSSRTIATLAQRLLIQVDEQGNITPQVECSIMARTLTKLKSMTILMDAAPHSGLKELMLLLVQCEELHRPVRRDEKKFLNDVKQHLRFFFKDKVQSPDKKSYVLIQAAIGRLQIKDFTLRVEQAEIVENAIRLLRSVFELAMYRKLGRLMESAVLLDRALKLRLWETSTQNIYHQCKGISEDSLTRIANLNKTSVFDIYGMNVQSLQAELGCRQDEARLLLQFSMDMVAAKLALTMALTTDNELQIRIFPAVDMERRKISTVIKYQLICYHVDSMELICWRSLVAGTMQQEFSIPLLQDTTLNKLRCCLYANVAGLDFVIGINSADIAPDSNKNNKASNSNTSTTNTSINTNDTTTNSNRRLKQRDIRTQASTKLPTNNNSVPINNLLTNQPSAFAQNDLVNNTNPSITMQRTSLASEVNHNSIPSTGRGKPDFSMFQYRPSEPLSVALSQTNEPAIFTNGKSQPSNNSQGSFASTIFKRKADEYMVSGDVKRVKSHLNEIDNKKSVSMFSRLLQKYPDDATNSKQPFFDTPTKKQPSIKSGIVQHDLSYDTSDFSRLLQKASNITSAQQNTENTDINVSATVRDAVAFDDAFL